MAIDLETLAHDQRSRHGPAWRRQLAEAIVTGLSPEINAQDDEHVREMCAYLRLMRDSPIPMEQIRERFAAIAVADKLQEDASIRKQLKVLVLGDCQPQEISRRLSIDSRVLAAWECMHFDVRPARDASDWILLNIIRPELDQGDEYLAAMLKSAWAGGAVVAWAILAAESRSSLKAGQRLFDLKIRLHLRLQQAVELPLDSNSAKLFFIKLHSELMLQEQKLHLAERRLEQKSREALARQQLAEERLALRRGREEARKTRIRQKDARVVAAKGRSCQSSLAQLTWACADIPEPAIADELTDDAASGNAKDLAISA